MKKTLLALGVVGLGSVIASPASAQQAYASGSATIVLMNGASQSIGGEIAAPGGASLGGLVTTTTTATNDLNVNDVVFQNLVVTPGTVSAAPAGSSFTAAAAVKLDDAVDLSDIVSIIRAGAGVDGLD